MRPLHNLPILVMVLSVVVLSGCMESTGEKNTEPPYSIETSLINAPEGHYIYITLYDFQKRMTTADGQAQITMFKGKFSNDPDDINKLVLSDKYNIKRTEFIERQVVTNELKRDLLSWSVKLPADKFTPEVGDVYKISARFTPAGSNQPIGNQTFLVWA